MMEDIPTVPAHAGAIDWATDAHTGAIDWATDAHTGAVVDLTGELVADYTFSHTAAGLAAMLPRFAEHGVERVAIERPDGPVVEALLDGGFTAFVIARGR